MDTTEKELQALRAEISAMRKEFGEQQVLLAQIVDAELQAQQKTLQALQQQIRSLDEQNSSLCIGLAKNQHILHSTVSSIGFQRYLPIYYTQLLGIKSAEFVINNMPKTKSFGGFEKNRTIGDYFEVLWEYLRYVVSKVEINAENKLMLEFGVFKGDSINFISSLKPNETIYGFDNFEGLPEDWTGELTRGTFTVHGALPPVNKNVRLVKGWFDETLPEFVKSHPQKCAFIHVDCDLYSSTKTIFDALKNQIGTGTVIAFDEYYNCPGFMEGQGEFRAFEEFVNENNVKFEYIARTEYQQVAVKIK